MYEWIKLRSDQVEFLKLVLKYMGGSEGVPERVRETLVDGYVTAALEFADNRYAELKAALEASVASPDLEPYLKLEPPPLTASLAAPKETMPVAPKTKASPKPKTSTKPTVGKKSPTARQTPNWTAEEDAILLGYKDVDPTPWEQIVERLPGRNLGACKARLKRAMESEANGKGSEKAADYVQREAADAALAAPEDKARNETNADTVENAAPTEGQRRAEAWVRSAYGITSSATQENPPPASHPADKALRETNAEVVGTVLPKEDQKEGDHAQPTKEVLAYSLGYGSPTTLSPTAHPAVKDDWKPIRSPTAAELMGKTYGR